MKAKKFEDFNIEIYNKIQEVENEDISIFGVEVLF